MTKLLPRNEGTADRVLRVILGVGLLSLALFGPQTCPYRKPRLADYARD